MKKKLLVFLSLVLIFTLCMGTMTFASAETKATDSQWNATEGVYWQFVPSTGTLMIYGKGAMGDYTFDDARRAYVNKNAVRYPWQNHADEITKVKICDGITHVGNWAFAYMKKIEKIEIANTVKDIGEGAFAYCTKIKEVSLPDSVKELKFQAFRSCTGLAKLNLNNVEKIGEQAFSNCVNLYGVVIPESVNEISSSFTFDSIKNIKFENSIAPTLTTIPNPLGSGVRYGCLTYKSTVNIYIPKGADKEKWMSEIRKTSDWNKYTTWNFIEYDDTAAKDLSKDLKIKVSSSKLIKGTKITAKVSSGDLKAIKDLGYNVTYKYYRSTKKLSGYQLMKESKYSTYKNTAGKKGTRYYYKASVEVTDACGDVIYTTSTKLQKPCYRTFK